MIVALLELEALVILLPLRCKRHEVAENTATSAVRGSSWKKLLLLLGCVSKLFLPNCSGKRADTELVESAEVLYGLERVEGSVG